MSQCICFRPQHEKKRRRRTVAWGSLGRRPGRTGAGDEAQVSSGPARDRRPTCRVLSVRNAPDQSSRKLKGTSVVDLISSIANIEVTFDAGILAISFL